MREYKFRAWDKKSKTMRTYNFWVNWSGKVYNSESYKTGYVSGLNRIDVILLQYTGLKDKNGQEIYEGDIIKTIIFNDLIKISEVIYNERECAYTHKDGMFFARYENEIIGNIYENPDIITKYLKPTITSKV